MPENIDKQKQLKERTASVELCAYDVLNNISAGVMVSDKEDGLVLFNNYFDKWEAGLKLGSLMTAQLRNKLPSA